MTDAEALQTDLSQSAVSVYGTPQGNLWLARYIAALPVVIEPNGITADRLYKGSNLRFISAWPHPQNGKLGMVIYTAQRAEDVVGINSIMHGPTDYLVAQGQTIVRAAELRQQGRPMGVPVFPTGPGPGDGGPGLLCSRPSSRSTRTAGRTCPRPTTGRSRSVLMRR